jgi:hypothetical protein
VVLSGTVTVSEGAPDEQATVFGSPVRGGVTEKAQLVAPVVEPLKVTAPPLEPSTVEVAVKEEMAGAAGPSTVTITGVALRVVFLFPLAVREKL